MDMSAWSEANAYYEENYQVAAAWCLRPGDKVCLGDKEKRTCRFCGKASPEASFRKDAHALPECIGNKGLFTYYECDDCNHAFGIGCENDFGNWSLPMRTMARICGKNGIPTIKQGPNNAWRVEKHPSGLSLSLDPTEGFYEDDEAQNTLKIHLLRAPYRPVMVVQAVVKMALTIMPEHELKNFQQALNWIRPGNDLTSMVAPTVFLHTFLSGPVASDIITVGLLTRQRDELVAPYAFFLLTYGHEMLQLAVPSEKDRPHYGKSMDIRRFPNFRDEGGAAPGAFTCRQLPFTSSDVVKNDGFMLDMQYEEKRPH
jgi:hypothetical protein